MAKKAETASPFTTEKTDWGVQLKIHPFNGIASNKHSMMSIAVNVHRPKQKGRRAEVRLWFSGVTGDLSQNETGMWLNAVRGIMDEAKRVGATLRASRA